MIPAGCICAYTWAPIIENGKVRMTEVRNGGLAFCPAGHEARSAK